MTVTESGMQFGPFDQDDIFYWEKSKLFTTFGAGTKSVEFICLDKENAFCLLEAKTTAPNPEGPKGQEGFDEYLEEISEKFIHTFDLFMATWIKRYDDKDHEMPSNFLAQDIGKITIKFLLVIKESKELWLRPINDALNRILLRYRKTWRIKVAVLNEDMALSERLIYHSSEGVRL